LFPLLPLVAIAGLSTAGMVLFLFRVFLVGLANASSLFILLISTFAPANNGGLLSFSPSESSPSSSCSPSLSGFLAIEGKGEDVTQCSVKPLLWSVVERFFLS
jgi:hypothetical protein